MPKTIHRFFSPFSVARQLWIGRTLTRTLFNLAVSGVEVSGRFLDIGSKNTSSSYYEYLRIAPDSDPVFTDLQEAQGVICLDVEKPFDLPDASFDFVLAFHLFEHIFRFQSTPSEIFRILKPGGQFMVVVPFLVEYHADPDDFFRYTDSALRRIGEEVGLKCIYIEAIGEGPITALATKLPTICLPRAIRPATTVMAYLATTYLDRLISVRPRIDGKSVAERFALQHFAIFQKPSE